MSFHGIIPAVMVPFQNDGREVDQEALRAHIDFMIAKGVHGLFVNGTMGEGMVLNCDERKQVAEVVVDQTAGRIPVVIQVTSINQAETLELTQHAQAIGAYGVSIIAPSFYPYDHAALKAFYMEIAQQVPGLPIYLYNNPGRSGNGLSPKLVAELAKECGNVVGIKDSSKDLILFQDYIDKTSQDFTAIIGTDGLVLTALAVGGRGVVSAIANPFPEPFVRLYDAFNRGDFAEAKKQNQVIGQLREALKLGPYLAAYKHAIQGRGHYRFGGYRKPLRDFNTAEKAAFEVALAAVDLEL